MLRALVGAAPSAGGWDAIRPSVRRASMMKDEGVGVEVEVVVGGHVDVDREMAGRISVGVRSYGPGVPRAACAELQSIVGTTHPH